MQFAWNYFFVLIWLAYMISSGVLLFSRGFLLSRVSKTDVSTCRRLSTNPRDDYFLTEDIVKEIFKDVNASANICLPQKSKVIILVIDALKYEFGIYKENLSNPLPYENKLTILNELIKSKPDQSRLMRFKADPPTTTLQRLKGLTTGSLPTFIDIGSNFASPEINEDNIIDQMVRNNLPVVFMGDSTWTDLYPKRFKRSYSYPSFDIFDLDTVDKKIEKYLPQELIRSDWQVLIAHFLGVDHCGHKHGPMHHEMSRKLSEMDQVIRLVVDKMDEETTLYVFGDHGMTASGDHGGDTEDETNALLFAHTKSHKFIEEEYGSDKGMLQQIDLVPTLATILGIPIPYSNLGLLNFNIIPDVAVPFMEKFQVLQLHAWLNAQQVHKYFYNYATENKKTFNVEQMDKLDTEYILLAHRVKTIFRKEAFKSFVSDMNKQVRYVLTTCRDIWVKFDASQMMQGLLITFLTIFFCFLLINNSRALDVYKIFTPKDVAYVYLMNLAAGVFGFRYYKNIGFKTEEHGIIFSTNILSIGILIFHTLRNWGTLAQNWASIQRFGNIPTRIILLIAVSVFFSNSFIIQEPKILSYLLAAIFILLAFELLQSSIRVDFKNKFKISQFVSSVSCRIIIAALLAICFIRFAYTLFRCREEQGNCSDFSQATEGFSLKTPASGKTYIMAVIIIVLYTTLTRLYLRSCGNLTGNSVNVLLARYGPTVASICTGGHILLANSAVKNIPIMHIDSMALVIYALFIIQIIVVVISPLMTFVVPPKTSTTTITANNHESIIPEIFMKMKRMYDGDETERRYEIPIVYGLATVYSSIVIAFGIFLAMVLLILLEPRSSIGMIICIAVGSILLTLHSILRFQTSDSFATCIQPTFKAIVAWFLLAHFCFFATSHQTTLSQIDWRAAFVGRHSTIGQSHFVSGFLVILNTFSGPLFFFVMYSLLCTETFSIYALFPNLIKSNYIKEHKNKMAEAMESQRTGNRSNSSQYALSDISNELVGFDMTRGELSLFENEVIFFGSSFKLAVQFFMLQGIKIFCAMLACTIHCRHLMVWKIFAPRFIYEGLTTFVSLPALIIGYLLLLRIHKAVDRLIKRINKIK